MYNKHCNTELKDKADVISNLTVSAESLKSL